MSNTYEAYHGFEADDSSLPEILEKCKGIEEVLNAINSDGSYLWKVRSTSKWFRRKFHIDIRDMKINYSPSSKSGDCCTGEDQPTNIREVRRGWKTDIFNKIEVQQEKNARSESGRVVDEGCCFSIIYGERRSKTLDLVASNHEIAEKWVKAIEHLISWYELKQLEAGYEVWLRKKFNSADSDHDKCLTFKETEKLLFDLNIEMTEGEAMTLFDAANTHPTTVGNQNIEVLNEDEFMILYFRLLRRLEIEDIFKSYLSPYGTFTAAQLQEFLQKDQGGYENISMDECSAFIQIYEFSDLKAKGQLTPAGLMNMLLSSEFDIFNQKQQKTVCQNMQHPLSHYYIASSHNTYITGNQISGKASLDAYIYSLKRGCKCVEIDCWDGDDGEPVVWHGHTFVTKISFREVLEDAIKPFAFVASNFPLILSLEVHCSLPVRQKLVLYLRAVFGDMLYTKDPVDTDKFLPSPHELQGKILVKAKRFYKDKNLKKETATTTTMLASSRSDVQNTFSHGSSSEQEYSILGGHKTTVNIQYQEATSMSNTEILYSDGRPITDKFDTFNYPNLAESDEDDENPSSSIQGNANDDKDLSSVVNLLQATKFASFEEAQRIGQYYEMSSFSEATAQKLIKDFPLDFVNHNKRQLSRIYPSATRALSSNFMPVSFWRVGCQIVALNYQTQDIPNLVNEAMFSQNGGCGYVLKPEFLRSETPVNPSHWFKNSCLLKLRIISAQHLPKAEGNSEVVDPYVEFKIIGIGKENDSSNEFTTKIVENNGFNPVWNESFEVRVKCPEFAFLFFRVRDHAQSGSDAPLCYYAIPFTAITTGYRHIRLKNIARDPIPPSTLFVHIAIEDSVSAV